MQSQHLIHLLGVWEFIHDSILKRIVLNVSAYANTHQKHLDNYITDYGEFIANIVLYCTFMAEYGARLLANVHKHLQLTQCLLRWTTSR